VAIIDPCSLPQDTAVRIATCKGFKRTLDDLEREDQAAEDARTLPARLAAAEKAAETARLAAAEAKAMAEAEAAEAARRAKAERDGPYYSPHQREGLKGTGCASFEYRDGSHCATTEAMPPPLIAGSPRACCEACMANADCKAFTFQPRGFKCFLQEKCAFEPRKGKTAGKLRPLAE